MTLEHATIIRLRRDLLRWYRRHHRRLPWRATGRDKPDPYHVLVSEAMLQQTQVVTVVAYFERFIKRFKTVRELARADEQTVLRLWQGLGYYRRARHLHAAAKMIVSEFDGVVPSTVEQLMRLPGVGRYTAGAIASIAFGQSAPIVDGNVSRVLSRWIAMRRPVDEPKVRHKQWELAATLVPKTNAGDFNQALMELGALVCLPRRPQCSDCPVIEHCRAHQLNMADKLPKRSPRRKPTAVKHHIVAIHRDRKCLLHRRRGDGLWPNMWQLPTAEQVDAGHLRQWISETFGLVTQPPTKIDSFRHQTTHRTIQFVLWQAHVRGGRLRRGAGIWRKLNAVDDLPLANPQRRALRMLADNGIFDF